MVALAPIRIDGPPPGPPPPYGLTTTPGTIVEPPDAHWRNGVIVESYPTDVPSTQNPCATGTSRVKPDATPLEFPEFSGFTVIQPIVCSGAGIGTEAGAQRLRDRARLTFLAVESYSAERELMFGDSDRTDRPHLTDENLVLLNGGNATGPREALSLLEQAIGETARNGFVHVGPASFDAMMAYGLFEADGATMRTKRGNTVIIGNGYIHAEPDSNPALSADQEFAFASGPVRLARDDIEVIGATAESLDRETNTITFRAERNYVVFWDTALQVGVNVDRSTTP
jgi:hypothetical protein